MHIARYRHFVIALLLLAFSCQLLANAAMTCELDKSTKATAANMLSHTPDYVHDMPLHALAAIDHSSHINHSLNVDHSSHIDHSSHMNSPTHKSASADCCKNMGHCAMGTCSLATANTNLVIFITKPLTPSVDFYSSTIPSPHISSLYRPPILG